MERSRGHCSSGKIGKKKDTAQLWFTHLRVSEGLHAKTNSIKKNQQRIKKKSNESEEIKKNSEKRIKE